MTLPELSELFLYLYFNETILEFRIFIQKIKKQGVIKTNGGRFVTLYRRQESRPSPRKRNARKQNGCLMRP